MGFWSDIAKQDILDLQKRKKRKILKLNDCIDEIAYELSVKNNFTQEHHKALYYLRKLVMWYDTGHKIDTDIIDISVNNLELLSKFCVDEGCMFFDIQEKFEYIGKFLVGFGAGLKFNG